MSPSEFLERYFFKTRYLMAYRSSAGATNSVIVKRLIDFDISLLPPIKDQRLMGYLEKRKKDPSWVFFAYLEGLEILGYSFLHIPVSEEWNDSLPTFKGEARISSAFVYPQYRGKGIRGEIYKMQYQYACEHSLKLWSVIEKSNFSSIKAASKTGGVEGLNYLIKVLGRNVLSIVSNPFRVYLLYGRRRVRR